MIVTNANEAVNEAELDEVTVHGVLMISYNKVEEKVSCRIKEPIHWHLSYKWYSDFLIMH